MRFEVRLSAARADSIVRARGDCQTANTIPAAVIDAVVHTEGAT